MSAAGETIAIHGQAPETDEEVLVALEARRLVREVGASGPAAIAAKGITKGRDCPDRGLLQHILCQPEDTHRVPGRQRVDVAGADQERAEIGFSFAAGDFHAGVERYFPSTEQADAATEERNDVPTRPAAAA